MTEIALFDRELVRRRLRRAAREGFAGFLVERAADDLAERLAAVTRDFPLALDLGTPTDAALRALEAWPRIGRALRAAPARELPGRTDLVADEEMPPLAPGRFGLIVSLMALHVVGDLPGALAQIRRALAPDGLFVACLLGGSTLTELRQAFVEAESEVEGGVSPRVAPFVDLRDMGGLLQRAGFALPVADVDQVVVRYPHALALMRDLRAMGLANPLHDRSRKPLRRATLRRALEIYAGRFADPDGRVRATFELVWVSGWAPHESQQKPLRPGAAKARLADALKAIELSAGEKAGGGGGG